MLELNAGEAPNALIAIADANYNWMRRGGGRLLVEV